MSGEVGSWTVWVKASEKGSTVRMLAEALASAFGGCYTITAIDVWGDAEKRIVVSEKDILELPTILTDINKKHKVFDKGFRVSIDGLTKITVKSDGTLEEKVSGHELEIDLLSPDKLDPDIFYLLIEISKQSQFVESYDCAIKNCAWFNNAMRKLKNALGASLREIYAEAQRPALSQYSLVTTNGFDLDALKKLHEDGVIP